MSTKTFEFTIPEQDKWDKEQQRCPNDCPFLNSDDRGQYCRLGVAVNRRWDMIGPGPDCPGAGTFTAVPKERWNDVVRADDAMYGCRDSECEMYLRRAMGRPEA